MDDEVLGRAWTSLEFTSDPVASSVLQSATDAADVGLLPEVPDITGLFDLTLLNEVLAAEGEPAVSGL
jgi:NitT/TauT family transport system substrate-binding protein